MKKTKKVLVLTACMVFLLAGLAKADNLKLGGNYTHHIYGKYGTTATDAGGGSIDPSYLNGEPLNYVYCLDLNTYVYVPGNYPDTVVNSAGQIYGSTVNNAGEVAWLLSQYGSTPGVDEYALQSAIWHVIYQGTANSYALDTSNSTPIENVDYTTYLTALNTYIGGGGNVSSLISNFLWITPKIGLVQYQGLVGQDPAVPEPATMLLLGSGSIGLAGFVRKKFKK